MTFKVLALVVEQIWHVYWISCCKKYLVSKVEIFTPFLPIHSDSCLQKLSY